MSTSTQFSLSITCCYDSWLITKLTIRGYADIFVIDGRVDYSSYDMAKISGCQDYFDEVKYRIYYIKSTKTSN